MTTRTYTTRRQGIVEALARELKKIDGTGDFLSNLYGNVEPTLKFWDEITEFPCIHINSGSESREYQAGGYKDRYLSVFIKVYVKEDESWKALARVLEDVETVLEQNQALQYFDSRNNPCYTQTISIVSIDTDEGVLEPFGVGEVLLEVRY